MAVKRGTQPEPQPRRRRPATTPEGRENQLIALAVEAADKQMRDGTASAQVITHYLKLGSTREKLEQERLAAENALLRAKVESMASAGDREQSYKDAIDAMRSYSGATTQEDYDD